VLANELESLLVLDGSRVLDPKGTVWLKVLTKTGGLNWAEAVVDVVEQVHVEANSITRGLEEGRDGREVLLARPNGLRRQRVVRWLIEKLVLGNTVGLLEAGNTRLEAYSLVALGNVLLQALNEIIGQNEKQNEEIADGEPR